MRMLIRLHKARGGRGRGRGAAIASRLASSPTAGRRSVPEVQLSPRGVGPLQNLTGSLSAGHPPISPRRSGLSERSPGTFAFF